jgi:hypothetical protein
VTEEDTRGSEMAETISFAGIYDMVAAQVDGTDPLIVVVVLLLVCFLLIRIAQRIYYMLRGHVHHVTYHPRQEMLLFLKKREILLTEHSFKCKRDNLTLRYRKLGTGSKIVLLNNGVGTDFYMWLPTLRGLFVSVSINSRLLSEEIVLFFWFVKIRM